MMVIKKMMIMMIVPLVIFTIYYKFKQIKIDRINLIQSAITCLIMSYIKQEEEDWKVKEDKTSSQPLSFESRIRYGNINYSVNLFLTDTITLSEKNSIHDPSY